MDKKIKKPRIESDEDFLEIKHGEMFLKVPNNLNDVIMAKNFLGTFEELLKQMPTVPLLIMKEEEEVTQEIGVNNDVDETVNGTVNETVELEMPELPKEEGIPTKCPLCQSKVKTSKPKTRDNLIYQVVKCKKNKWFGKCKFEKEYAFKI